MVSGERPAVKAVVASTGGKDRRMNVDVAVMVALSAVLAVMTCAVAGMILGLL